MKVSWIRILVLLCIPFFLSACSASAEKPQRRAAQVTVAAVQLRAVTLKEQYSCQIRAHHYVDVRTPRSGYLTVSVRDGQKVNEDDLMFRVASLPGQAENDERSALIKAPFSGVLNRILYAEGSLVQQGDTLTTLADNSQIHAYFHVSDARYLEYQSTMKQVLEEPKIELLLDSGNKFAQAGTLAAIGADFNAKTGTVPFRADFPNPEHQLRHGQRGVVVISHVQNDALVIPQQATFEFDLKRYVYVVDKDDVAHQREVVIANELDDLFVVKSGVSVDDKIVVDGVRRVHNGEKVDYEHKQPTTVAAAVK